MADFDHQAFFKVLYDSSEPELIHYLKQNSSSLPQGKLEQVVSTSIQRKKWEVFKYCIDSELIQTELFEYDSFNDRMLSALFLQFKTISQTDPGEWLPHFAYFLDQLDDINEQLAGHNLLSFLIQEGHHIAMINATIDRGITMDYINGAEENYLHLACNQRKNNQPGYGIELIKLFLDHGVDINKQNIEGKTPIFMVMGNYRLCNSEVLRLLLDNGADPLHMDKAGLSPIYIAAVHLHDANLV